MQKLNSTILFPITCVLYVVLIIGLSIVGTNNLTLEENLAPYLGIGLTFLLLFLIVSIIAIIEICTSNIDKKWKYVLLFSWVIFTPIYLIIYYVKFKSIFAKKLINNPQVEIKKINISSFLSFILLVVFLLTNAIMGIVYLVLHKNQESEFLAGEFSTLALISLLVYSFVYVRLLYLSMFNNQPKISCVCKIPLACSFVWMYSRKIVKN